MMDRAHVYSGSPWEETVGYSRAIRAGNLIFVSGTTATDHNGVVRGPGDAYIQTRQAIENIRTALAWHGALLEHVVRTRIYVVNISLWEEVARAHREAFAEIAPATSMVEVSRLIHPDMLVEIEAAA